MDDDGSEEGADRCCMYRQSQKDYYSGIMCKKNNMLSKGVTNNIFTMICIRKSPYFVYGLLVKDSTKDMLYLYRYFTTCKYNNNIILIAYLISF